MLEIPKQSTLDEFMKMEILNFIFDNENPKVLRFLIYLSR